MGDDPVKESFTTLAEPVEGKDVLRYELLAAARVAWGQNFQLENVVVHHRDVTCDEVPDYIASHINEDSPDGPLFNILIATEHEGEIRTDAMSIPFQGSSEQYGLCMVDNKPAAEVWFDVWPHEEIDEYLNGMDVCPIAIDVVDGMCDTPRFFWLNTERKDVPRWVFFRH